MVCIDSARVRDLMSEGARDSETVVWRGAGGLLGISGGDVQRLWITTEEFLWAGRADGVILVEGRRADGW